MLKLDMPDATPRDLDRIWSADGGTTGEFAGCEVEFGVVLGEGGKLLAFVKLLITHHEVFVEHVISDESVRGVPALDGQPARPGWRCAQHLLARMLHGHIVDGVRLQVRIANTDAISFTYEPIGFVKDEEYVEEDCDAGCMMMCGEVETVAAAAQELASKRPLPAGVTVRMFSTLDGEETAGATQDEARRRTDEESEKEMGGEESDEEGGEESDEERDEESDEEGGEGSEDGMEDADAPGDRKRLRPSPAVPSLLEEVGWRRRRAAAGDSKACEHDQPSADHTPVPCSQVSEPNANANCNAHPPPTSIPM